MSTKKEVTSRSTEAEGASSNPLTQLVESSRVPKFGLKLFKSASLENLTAKLDSSFALKKSRAGYLGHLTRLYRESENLILDGVRDSLVQKLPEVEEAWRRLMAAHQTHFDSLQFPIEREVADKSLAEMQWDKSQFDSRVAAYLGQSSQCPSIASTNRSSTSSIRMKEAQMKKKMAQMKQRKLKDELQLKKKFLELEVQQKLLDAKVEEETAEVEEEFWGPSETSSDHGDINSMLSSPLDPRSKDELLNKFLECSDEHVEPSTQNIMLNSQNPVHCAQKPVLKSQNPVHSIQNPVLGSQNPVHSTQKPVLGSQNPVHNTQNPVLSSPDSVPSTQNPVSSAPYPVLSTLNPRAAKWEPQGSMMQFMQAQTQAYQQMAETLKSGFSVPKPEILTFDGSPETYVRFVNNFETSFSQVTDLSLKLNYLIQHCRGTAKEAIECCIVLDNGYQRACEILRDLFGRPHIIARAHVNKLVNGPELRSLDATTLTRFLMDLQTCEATLTELGYTADLDNSSNLLKIAARLPERIKPRWLDRVDHILTMKEREPKFCDIREFVTERLRVVGSMYGVEFNNSSREKRSNKSGQGQGQSKSYSGGSNASSKYGKTGRSFATVKNVCVLCSKGHELVDCYIFQRKSLPDKKAFMREKRLCHNCFEPGHIGKGCLNRSACTVSGCKWKHHTLLHDTSRTPHLNANRQSRSQTGSQNTAGSQLDLHAQSNTTPHSQSSQVNSNTSSQSGSQSNSVTRQSDTQPKLTGAPRAHTYVTGAGAESVSLRVVPVYVSGPNGTVETYALLDCCSDVSLCSQSLVNELGIVGKDSTISLSTVSAESTAVKSEEVALTVQSLDGTEVIEIERVWVVPAIPIAQENIPVRSHVEQWPHLQGVSLPEVKCEQVGVLIGADIPEAFWVIEERRGGRKQPTAVKTPLGWTICGPLGVEGDKSFHVYFTSGKELDLHQQLQEMWSTDFNEVKATQETVMSVEDKKATAIMEDTLVQLPSGHYQLSLPWRSHPPPLQNNKAVAERRLQSLKSRLRKDEVLHGMYTQAVQEYVEKGYASIVPEEKLVEGRWYLPHHPVTHPRKPGKVRVVFDAAAKYRGVSLNDQLLKGPDNTNSLVGVLTRFREGPVAVTGDIQAMFNQVKVSPSDRPYLRFLWWPGGDLDQEPREFEMNVHIFGATSSPSCAGYCLRRVASDHGEHFSDTTVQVVQRSMYVDDVLKAAQRVKSAVQIVQELPLLLGCGGFKVTKWNSNSPEVRASVPEEDRMPQVVDLDLDQNPGEKALGVTWCVTEDQFKFTTMNRQQPLTRRGILSMTSSLFDPLGLVAPFLLPAKELLQDLCRQKLGWDDPVDEQQQERWHAWLAVLDDLGNISVPRCIVPAYLNTVCEFQLHHFSDASNSGYGAVSYLRVADSSGQIHCSILMGKSRVTPLKAVTIPRLELTAAVVAVRLDYMLKQELDLKIDNSIFWTDSTCVLGYINNENRRFQTFVANRLAVIHDNTSPHQWRHISTELNPADHASRGLNMKDPGKIQQWFEGPKFLWLHESNWPEQPKLSGLPEGDPEVKKETHVHSITVREIEHPMKKLVEKFSSWKKLVKAVAWLLKVRKMLLNRVKEAGDRPQNSGVLSIGDVQEASQEVIKYVQREAFLCSKGYQSPAEVSKGLRSLNPVRTDGVWRVGGRLDNAPLAYDARHQVILPKKGSVVDMIIRYYHETEGHSGVNHVLAAIRGKYWIVNGRSAVKRVLNKCIICKKQHARRGEQIMASLPQDRLEPAMAPFTKTGVDYFGPYFVKCGRSMSKRYGCIFTCLTSRAVHLEVAHSLDMDSFLSALSRFICRRSQPLVIRSDNGTNFKAGDRELRDAIQGWNQQRIQNYMLQREIKWSYNPPSASHMGGVWERLIRSVRCILNSLVRQQTLTDETLTTFMAEVEKILNDRPLTALSDSPDDLEPLTPNHILLLKRNASVPPGIFRKEDQYLRRRWRQAQYLSDVFWKRWIHEYLPTLQARQKWMKHRHNFLAGDLVLVASDNMSRGDWPLGRVVKTFPDRHGVVRSVEVRTVTGCLVRPITCLCLLESETMSELSAPSEAQSELSAPSEAQSELSAPSEAQSELSAPSDGMNAHSEIQGENCAQSDVSGASSKNGVSSEQCGQVAQSRKKSPKQPQKKHSVAEHTRPVRATRGKNPNHFKDFVFHKH